MAKFYWDQWLIMGLLVTTSLAGANTASAEAAHTAATAPLSDDVVGPLPEELQIEEGTPPSPQAKATKPETPPKGVVGARALVPPELADPNKYSVDAERATSFKINGSIGVAGRGYFDEAPFPGEQKVNHVYGYAFGTVNAEYHFSDQDRIKASIYGRGTPFSSYSLVDPRELYFIHAANTWDFLVGFDTVAWGVTESRHLVDVINQRDPGGNLDDDEDRLGQPMANLNLISPTMGTLSLYTLFGFRERDLPEPGDRLRQQFVVSEGDAKFGGNNWEKNVNFAGRYTNSFGLLGGSMDVGLSYFHGLSRDPRLQFVPEALPPAVLAALPPGSQVPGKVIPIYDVMNQIGLEGLFAYKDLQLKLEGLSRWQNGEQYFASVSGFEYTLHDMFNGGADIGLLGEYLWDGRSSNQPATPFDNDVFGGVRVTLNDVGSTRILAGVTVDVADQETYGSVEFEHRLRDDLLLSIDARTFNGIPKNDQFGFLNTESFVEMALQKFF